MGKDALILNYGLIDDISFDVLLSGEFCGVIELDEPTINALELTGRPSPWSAVFGWPGAIESIIAGKCGYCVEDKYSNNRSGIYNLETASDEVKERALIGVEGVRAYLDDFDFDSEIMLSRRRISIINEEINTIKRTQTNSDNIEDLLKPLFREKAQTETRLQLLKDARLRAKNLFIKEIFLFEENVRRCINDVYGHDQETIRYLHVMLKTISRSNDELFDAFVSDSSKEHYHKLERALYYAVSIYLFEIDRIKRTSLDRISSDNYLGDWMAFRSELKSIEKSQYPYAPLEDLNLTVRSFNCLKRAGLSTVRDLANISVQKLLSIKNIGKKSPLEIIEKLIEYNAEVPNQVD